MNSPSPSSIRDALQGQTIEGFDPSQFESLGGKLYYSLGSAMNQVDIHTLVNTWQSVHMPTFGHLIPQSSEVLYRSMDSGVAATVMAPTNNQVQVMNQLSITNGGEGTATITGTITDTNSALSPSMVIISESLTAGQTVIIGREVKVDSNATLTLVASAGGFEFGAYLHLVVQ